MTIIVTGAAGFIGSNIVKALNQRGITDIVAVDNLTRGEKFKNLAECEIAHYFDKHEFIRQVRGHLLPYENIEAVFHQGACSGYSKFLFDQVLRRRMKEGLTAQVVGFRYFNVYGQHEQHKGRMASVAFHHFHQYREHGYVNLFGSNDGYGNGEQTRDFVSVEDVAKVNLYFFDHPELSGIYNLGTGRSQQFNELAAATVNACRAAEGKPEMSLKELVEEEFIRYIPFPDALKGKYQSFTQADITKLREAGYKEEFLDVKSGVDRYVKWMLENLA